jgi:hypothetical protein
VLHGDIATPTIAFRNVPTDKPSPVEYLEVMSQQIAGHAHKIGEFTHRSVAQGQVVDNPEPLGITEGRVNLGSAR